MAVVYYTEPKTGKGRVQPPEQAWEEERWRKEGQRDMGFGRRRPAHVCGTLRVVCS